MKTSVFLFFLLIWGIACEIPSVLEIQNYFEQRLSIPVQSFYQKASILSAMRDAKIENSLDKTRSETLCRGLQALEISSNDDSKTLYEIYNAHAYLKCSRNSGDQQTLRDIIKKSKTFESQYYLELLKYVDSGSKELKSLLEHVKIEETSAGDLKSQIRLHFIKCLSQKKQDFTDLFSKIVSAEGEVISKSIHEHLYILNSIASCQPNLLENKQSLKSLSFVLTHFTYDNEILKYLHHIMAILKKSQIIMPKIKYSKKFSLVDSKNILRMEIWDYSTGKLISKIPPTKISSFECDGNPLGSNQYSLQTESSSVVLKLDSKFKKCHFDFEFEKSAKIIFESQKISVFKQESVKLIDISFSSANSLNPDQLTSSSISFGDKIRAISGAFFTKILMNFYITSGNQRISPKHVFMQFYHKDFMVSFPATVNLDRFTLDVDFEKYHKRFFDVSGSYQVKIIVEDRDYCTIEWDMGEIFIAFSHHPKFIDWDYRPKPTTMHTPKILFRSPMRIITLAFSLIVLGLVFSLFMAWGILGVGIEFKFGLWRFAFYASFLSIFYLLYLYWTSLDVFDAIKLYLLAAFLTCFSLNYVLTPKVKV